MKTVILRSLLIAIMLGVALTLISSVLMATYHQSSDSLGINRILTGHEAVSAMIKAFGLVGYLQSLFGAFILFFIGIFLGAFWQGAWTLHGKR